MKGYKRPLGHSSFPLTGKTSSGARPQPRQGPKPMQPRLVAWSEAEWLTALPPVLATLGVPLDEAQQQRCAAYMGMLAHWNTTYNLTAVRDPAKTKFVYRDELWQGADLLGLGVASFSHVAGGVNVWVAGSHELVYQYAMVHLDPGFKGKFNPRSDADGDDNQVASNLRAIVEDDPDGLFCSDYFLDGSAGSEFHAGLSIGLLCDGRAFLIEDGIEYPVLHLHHDYLQPPFCQGFGYTDTDKPAADNDGPLSFFNIFVHCSGIGDRQEGEDTLLIAALQLRYYRNTPGGEQ